MENDGRPEVPGSVDLERRVARLEVELAALREQLLPAAPDPGRQEMDHIRPAAYTPPRPPPIPPRTPAFAFTSPLADLAPRPPERSLENRLGSQVFNRIGILLLLIGTAWFLKYAIDRAWIGPLCRVTVGLLAGAGIVLWSERFRNKGFSAFSYSLKALGAGVLYLSLWAAFQVYHLLPAAAALVLMVLVTAWNAYMAAAQDSELLAAYALAGGFATPLLLSTGGDHEVFLFSYLLALDLAIVALVRVKAWPRLLLGAFPMTLAFFIGWYSEFFAPAALGTTTVFILLFDSTFSSVPLRFRSTQPAVPECKASRATLIEEIAVPLANAAFLSLSLYSVLQDSGRHALLPWLMLVLAMVYLAFMRLPQSRTAAAIHLSLAVVFLTIAIPLKASGHWITVGWLVEGLALLWVAARLASTAEQTEAAELYASRTLRWLGCAALVLGLGGVLVRYFRLDVDRTASFFNADTATTVTGIVIFGAALWVALQAARKSVPDRQSWAHVAHLSLLAVLLNAIVLTLREVLLLGSARHAAFRTPEFLTAALGLAVLAGVVTVSLQLASTEPEDGFWTNSAAFATIAFNLVAVLAGVREVSALWDIPSASSLAGGEAALQQALAISAFLMLYGAALLAAGFWKRSAFLRWQGLALLVFTILKTFAYDMRNLSQGYRVASFLGLGALLMVVSFAYQKDWLALREPAPPERPEALP